MIQTTRRSLWDKLTNEQRRSILEADHEPECPRCHRVILAGGCPYEHTDCPQFREQTDA